MRDTVRLFRVSAMLALVLIASAIGIRTVDAKEPPIAEPKTGAAPAVTLEKLDGKIRVNVDGKLFTEYDYSTYAKPILYPVLGPGQTGMTRNYSMRDGVQGEATDHPHHKSIWFAHGDVNGTDFWSEKGKIVHDEIVVLDENPQRPSVTTKNRWIDADGKVVCTDTTTVAFLAIPGGRMIDLTVTLHASHGDIVLGDTKEGTMAIRTHPNLRLENSPKHGVTTANGKAINSEGVTGKDVWGKRAKWIDYSGTIGGRHVGVAIMDHPGNLQHPTPWHARTYGLIGANPFGLSDFFGEPEGSGTVTVKSGDSLTFRYRLLFHDGDAIEAKVKARYQEFSAEPTKHGKPTKSSGPDQ